MKKSILVITAIILSTVLLPFSISAESTMTDDELNEYIQSEFAKTHIPNMSVEIVDTDSVLFTGNYGDSASADTPFILGSISKSFTAVAIMQLVDQGKIDIDNAAASYLPDIMDASCKTTVRQLLNHTSGIRTNMTLESFSSSDTTAGYEYANVNYNLLGLIVESVSGISYGEYIETNIYEPLGMNHSYVSLEEAKENNIASGHRNYFGIMVDEEFDYPKTMTSGWMTLSAAYLISTANDMGKYLQFWLGGNENVLTENSRNAVFQETTPVIDGYEYGFGWGINRMHDITMYVHGGNVENYTTYMILLPDIEKAVIVLTDACDYFSANDMVITLAENIGCKLSDVKTTDIDDSAYMKTHILLDVAMLVIIAAAVIPLVFIKKWYIGIKKTFKTVFLLLLLHGALPTLFMFVPTILGSPMWVAVRFAPDLSYTLIISSTLLYLTGILKTVCIIRKKPQNAS